MASASHSVGSWRRLRRLAADGMELVFGADPGLLRLKVAARTVLSAAITMTALLLITRGEGMKVAAAAIALGFLTSIFSNMTVRDPSARQQATTLALLILPALASVSLASFLSPWPIISDCVFVAVVMAAALARGAGPRGMALGMIGFIAYFAGVIIHPPLAEMPLLAGAVAIGLSASALNRFLFFPDDPQKTLEHVRGHLDRRIDRILGLVDGLLDRSREEHAAHLSEAEIHQVHYEIARLNDALLIAQEQIEQLDHAEEQRLDCLSDSLFGIELAAERIARLSLERPARLDNPPIRQRIRALRAVLKRTDVPEPPPEHKRRPSSFIDALDDLQRAASELAALTKTPSAPLTP